MNDEFAGLEMANAQLLFAVSGDYGQREKPGRDSSNKWILQLIQSHDGGVFRWATDDGEVAWCAIYMEYLLLSVGAIQDVRTNAGATALALSWRYSGRRIASRTEKRPGVFTGGLVYYGTVLPGDLAIFTRRGGGHVALIKRIDYDLQVVYVEGGNQNNAVTVSAYKLDRLVQVRRLFLHPGKSAS